MAAQYCSDSGFEFVGAKGFTDVVVGAAVQGRDDVGLSIAAGHMIAAGGDSKCSRVQRSNARPVISGTCQSSISRSKVSGAADAAGLHRARSNAVTRAALRVGDLSQCLFHLLQLSRFVIQYCDTHVEVPFYSRFGSRRPVNTGHLLRSCRPLNLKNCGQIQRPLDLSVR
jgi:hypothetical protein